MVVFYYGLCKCLKIWSNFEGPILGIPRIISLQFVMWTTRHENNFTVKVDLSAKEGINMPMLIIVLPVNNTLMWHTNYSFPTCRCHDVKQSSHYNKHTNVHMNVGTNSISL